MSALADWIEKNMATLDRLNSLTKYPSIPTYHGMGDKGVLVESQITNLRGKKVYGTEKVDGTNARIIILPEGFLIGSREELLYGRGDMIGSPVMGIVDALKETAENVWERNCPNDPYFMVAWGEVYGGKVGSNSKQYTGQGNVGFRLFDVALLDVRETYGWDAAKISLAREQPKSFQVFFREEDLDRFAEDNGLERVPNIYEGTGDEIPADFEGVQKFLEAKMPKTLVGLDHAAGGRPEGVILRTEDREVICKIRYEDYERTLRRLKK